MTYLFYIFLGLSPALFWLWYFYQKDRWEPEPKKQVLKIFLFGVFSIVPAGIIELILQEKVFNITIADMQVSLIMNLIICFIVIGPIEELFKYSVVKVSIYDKEDFNEKMDGVVYMVAAAMGFAALENVMYILRVGLSDPDAAPMVGILRGVLATPAHAIFSGYMGVFLGKARFAETKLQGAVYIAQGLFIASMIHGAYNSLLFAGNPYSFLVIPLLIISGVILMGYINQFSKESPFHPSNREKSEEQASS